MIPKEDTLLKPVENVESLHEHTFSDEIFDLSSGEARIDVRDFAPRGSLVETEKCFQIVFGILLYDRVTVQ